MVFHKWFQLSFYLFVFREFFYPFFKSFCYAIWAEWVGYVGAAGEAVVVRFFFEVICLFSDILFIFHKRCRGFSRN